MSSKMQFQLIVGQCDNHGWYRDICRDFEDLPGLLLHFQPGWGSTTVTHFSMSVAFVKFDDVKWPKQLSSLTRM
jgi:hypothetical protein